ncbi:MAG: hypothetical protein LBE92_09510 [Chryseobacterium sp.]|jgi:hypothetical protein|uniref:hypothetical protein n=1 Tax=Chryseobacterium sp. TaxID=1871047 RepID=UPI002821AD01|nr:hypothetical protein [Chryseobacterium sp.]MDR2236350.1 hypothetical protein [Chryseobacterium sp.]
MANELYFIKTNPNIAKINLYNKISREEEGIMKFLPDDAKVSLEIIKKKVKDSVEHLTKEELATIFDWFSSFCPSDHEEAKTQLFINGIDLFYEISHENRVKNFQQLLSDYENYSQQKLEFMMNSQNFNQFLIYGMFFTDLASEGKGSVNMLSHYLKPDHPGLYNFAEDQFKANGPEIENPTELQRYFGELYDLTRFYQGSIIKLDQ